MPFKQSIIPFLDAVDKDIVDLNVVNTLIKLKNKLIGYNTDFIAINTILKKITGLKNKQVVILGNGSMAKTIGYAAIMNGARTTIVSRSEVKAKILADALRCSWTSMIKLKSIKPDVLINSTSVGMNPNVPERIVPKNIFRRNMIAFDVVCNANGTQFMKDAADSGCKVIRGEELFELQAKYQSKIFMDAIK
jgi:shikimate dehydrogenase